MNRIDLRLGDCLEILKTIPDDSIDLVVTSPPYNKNYWLRNRNQKGKRIITYDSIDDMMEPNEYVLNQKNILNELIRVIKPTGSIFYNHIDIFHKHTTIHPSYVYEYPLKQIIVWDRGNTPKLDKSYYLPTTEYFFWIKKTKDAIPYFDRSKSIHKKNIWRINKEKNNPHPAPFPLEIVDNIIQGCSKENDVIMDCYLGSGTSCISAIKNNRHFIGIDISKSYLEMTKERIKKLN
jgi:site-specific DNA-methyltransferase (adenine-specific)